MKRGSTKVNFKEQVDLHSIKKKPTQCNLVTYELRHKTFNWTQLWGKASSQVYRNKDGSKWSKGFFVAFLLLLPFCIEVSDSIFPASSPARRSQSLRPHPGGPRQYKAHPWWKKDSSNSPVSVLHFHKQIFEPTTEQFIDSPQVLIEKKKR